MTPLKSADLDSADDRFRGTVRGLLLLLDGKLSSRAISREKALFDSIGYRMFRGKGGLRRVERSTTNESA